MRNVYAQRILVHPGFPTFVEIYNCAALLNFRCREMNRRTSHGFTCSHSNSALIILIYCTIKMINNSIVIYHITFMGKQIVVFFGRKNQIGTFPVVPVNQIITARKGIVRLIRFVGTKCRKIKHYIQIAKLLNLSIAGNHPLNFVSKNRISRKTLPVFHIL